MSYNLSVLIACPTVQMKLNEFTEQGANPNEPAPEIQFLTSQANTNRVLESRVIDEDGSKLKRVQVIYTPRMLESETVTALTTGCSSGNEAGHLSTTYEIDPSIGVEKTETIVIADLARICQRNPDYFAQRILAVIDVVTRKMQTQVASQMSLAAGWFALDNGEIAIPAGNSGPKVVATKFAAAIDGGKWNPEALQEIMFSATNSGFTGIPYVFGFGAIWRYWNYLIGLGNFSDGGMDFMKYVNQNQAAFAPSQKMHQALNGSNGTNDFLVVDAGALHLLQYNRYNDELNKVSGGGSTLPTSGTLIQDVLVDPKTGVEWNYKIVRNCAETLDITVSTAFKVVKLPTDMYQATDRLYNTNGVLKFRVTNT